MTVVIDASYSLALTMPDENTPASAGYVLGQDLIAPYVWPVELANAARKAIRRRRVTAEMARQATAAVRAFSISIEPSTSGSASWYFELAERYDLTPWDALYVDLALKGQHELASQDAAMIAAARRLGITVHE
jgi:predicted nucleic acid-binding protein